MRKKKREDRERERDPRREREVLFSREEAITFAPPDPNLLPAILKKDINKKRKRKERKKERKRKKNCNDCKVLFLFKTPAISSAPFSPKLLSAILFIVCRYLRGIDKKRK